SKLLRGFLLKDITPPEITPAPLPQAFSDLAGYYLPVNHRTEISRMFVDIQSVMKFSVSENYLHRQPLFGGWQSNDYTLDGETLIDSHVGLPTIAIVEDPLAGRVVQVGADLFKPISAV